MATFTESFDGALDLTWDVVRGTEPITVNPDDTGSVDTGTDEWGLLRADHDTGSADMFAEVTLTQDFNDTDRYAVLLVRAQSTTDQTYYAAILNQAASWCTVLRYEDGGATVLGTADETVSIPAAPFVFRFEAEGSDLRVLLNGTVVKAETDSAITGTRGGLGVRTGGTTVRFDDWSTGEAVDGPVETAIGRAGTGDAPRVLTPTKASTLDRLRTAGTARSLTAVKVLTAGRPGATGATRSLTAVKVTALGRAGAVGAARPLSAGKATLLGPTATTGVARALRAAKATGIGRAGVTGAGRAVAPVKTILLGRAPVAGGARALATSKATALGRAGEASGGRELTPRGALGRVANVAGARPLASSKATALGRAASTGRSRSLAAARTVPLGRAGDTAGTRPIEISVTEVLGPVGARAGARRLASSKATALGRARSASGARRIGPYVPVWPLRAASPTVAPVGLGALRIERVATGTSVMR